MFPGQGPAMWIIGALKSALGQLQEFLTGEKKGTGITEKAHEEVGTLHRCTMGTVILSFCRFRGAHVEKIWRLILPFFNPNGRLYRKGRWQSFRDWLNKIVWSWQSLNMNSYTICFGCSGVLHVLQPNFWTGVINVWSFSRTIGSDRCTQHVFQLDVTDWTIK